MTLQGKHALITGSSRGIGRGIALKMAESGVNVGVHYYQNEAAANDTLAKVRERGADGFVVQADVRNPEDIGGMFKSARYLTHRVGLGVSLPRAYRWHKPLMHQITETPCLLGAGEPGEGVFAFFGRA